MLTQMRALSQNIVGRAILGLVLVITIASFAIWGIGDRFGGYDANQIARIGTQRITVDDYRTAFQNELQRLQQQQKRGITGEEARRLGVDHEVLTRLLTDALLDQQAAKLGLAVGNGEVTRTIMEDGLFKGQSGQFDRTRFDTLLRDNGFNETTYATLQRRLILRRDISDAVAGGLALPKALTEAVHRYKAEVRDADFFILPPSAAGVVAQPGEAELKTYYDAHAGSYTAPEFRTLAVLSIVPVDRVKPDAITDDEIKTRYEGLKDTLYSVPERRTVAQLVFADQAAAAAAKAKIAAGASFDALVAAEKKTPADVSLGTVTKATIADKAVADAAFALTDGATSAPVATPFGAVLVHVSKIEPGRTQPLVEVAPELRNQIAILRAKKAAQQDADAIENARTGGKTLAEAAATVGLKVRAIDGIDAQGRDRAGKPVEGLVAGPQLLKAAFATEPNSDTEMLRTPQSGFEWYEVGKVDPAHQLPLADVKAKVEAAWRAEETNRKLAAEGDAIVKALEGGETLAAAAVKAGNQPIQQARDVGRGGAPNLPASEALALFGRPVGKVGAIAAGPRGRLIFQVLAARVPPVPKGDAEFDKLVAQVKSRFEDDVTGQYLAKVQGEVGVELNQKALQSALGGESGS